MNILRTFQQTPGAYPKPPTNSLWRNSFHLAVWGCLGYAPGVCWGSLRNMQTLPFKLVIFQPVRYINKPLDFCWRRWLAKPWRKKKNTSESRTKIRYVYSPPRPNNDIFCANDVFLLYVLTLFLPSPFWCSPPKTRHSTDHPWHDIHRRGQDYR